MNSTVNSTSTGKLEESGKTLREKILYKTQKDLNILDLDLQRDMYYYAFYSVLDSQSYILALERIEKSRVRLHKLQEEREMEEREITGWDKKIKRWWSKLSRMKKSFLAGAFLIGFLLMSIGAPDMINVMAVFAVFCALLFIYVFGAIICVWGYLLLVFSKAVVWWFLGLINKKEDRENSAEFVSRLFVASFMSIIICSLVYVVEESLPIQATIDVYRIVSLALIFALAIDRKAPYLRISRQKLRDDGEILEKQVD